MPPLGYGVNNHRRIDVGTYHNCEALLQEVSDHMWTPMEQPLSILCMDDAPRGVKLSWEAYVSDVDVSTTYLPADR